MVPLLISQRVPNKILEHLLHLQETSFMNNGISHNIKWHQRKNGFNQGNEPHHTQGFQPPTIQFISNMQHHFQAFNIT